MKPKIILFAKKDCKACHGTGVVYDSVPEPFGAGSCSMPSDCECAFEDLPEELLSKIDSNEIDFVIEEETID